VGGGVGVAPLLFFAHELLKTMHRDKVTVLLGARTKEELTAVTRDFEQMGLVAKIATDDGSLGHHGLVTELLQDLAEKDFLSVSACGPYPMMRAVAGQCAARGWRCQVSLETMMACGVAACLGCAVRKVGEPGYAHVCKDGPVFAAEEVLWR
jgi:dihydroorotate dehydrogenase electron transfer subunit